MLSWSTPSRGVAAGDASDDDGEPKGRWWRGKRQSRAERCVRAMEGGLRHVLETDGLVPCAVECAAHSDDTVRYRIVGGGVEMYGTIVLTAGEEGRFDAAFGAGRLPASDGFGNFQALLAKLSAVFHAERLARNRGGRF